jgi:hypothetical protein
MDLSNFHRVICGNKDHSQGLHYSDLLQNNRWHLRLKLSVQCLCEWVQKPYLVRLVLLGKHDDAMAKAEEVVSKIY